MPERRVNNPIIFHCRRDVALHLMSTTIGDELCIAADFQSSGIVSKRLFNEKELFYEMKERLKGDGTKK